MITVIYLCYRCQWQMVVYFPDKATDEEIANAAPMCVGCGAWTQRRP